MNISSRHDPNEIILSVCITLHYIIRSLFHQWSCPTTAAGCIFESTELSYWVHVIQRLTTVFRMISPRSSCNEFVRCTSIRFIPTVYAYVGSVRKHRPVPCQKMMPPFSQEHPKREPEMSWSTENCTFRRLLVLSYRKSGNNESFSNLCISTSHLGPFRIFSRWSSGVWSSPWVSYLFVLWEKVPQAIYQHESKGVSYACFFAVARLPRKWMLILLRYQKMSTIEPNRKYSTLSEGWKKM